MTFSQFVALLAFLAAALPLGAVGMVTVLYGAVALGRAPLEAAVLFERLAGRAYCWAMIADLGTAFLLIGGWTARLLLLAVIASFLRGVLDFLPWIEAAQDDGETERGSTAGRLMRLRAGIAVISAIQWLFVLVVYVRLVL